MFFVGIDQAEQGRHVVLQRAEVGVDVADRVVDLMGDTGGQLPDRSHLLRLQQLVVRFLQSFDQHPLLGLFLVQRLFGALALFQLLAQRFGQRGHLARQAELLGRLAVAHAFSDRIGQQVHVDGLGDVALDADRQRLAQAAVLPVGGDDDDLGVGIFRLDRFAHQQAVHARHEDVGHRHIGLPFPPLRQTFLTVGGKLDFRDEAAGQVLHLGAQDRVVVDDEDAGLDQSGFAVGWVHGAGLVRCVVEQRFVEENRAVRPPDHAGDSRFDRFQALALDLLGRKGAGFEANLIGESLVLQRQFA